MTKVIRSGIAHQFRKLQFAIRLERTLAAGFFLGDSGSGAGGASPPSAFSSPEVAAASSFGSSSAFSACINYSYVLVVSLLQVPAYTKGAVPLENSKR